MIRGTSYDVLPPLWHCRLLLPYRSLETVMGEENAKSYWDLGNAVTAFSVAQSMLTMASLLSSEAFKHVFIGNATATHRAIYGTFAFQLVYILAASLCFAFERSWLRDAILIGQRWKIFWGRIATMLVFAGLLMVVFYVAKSGGLGAQEQATSPATIGHAVLASWSRRPTMEVGWAYEHAQHR